MDPGTPGTPATTGAVQPPARGCDRHSVTVSRVDGADVNIGELCGYNTGQRLTIHPRSDESVMPVTLTFQFSGSQPYQYNIKVTQVRDHSLSIK